MGEYPEEVQEFAVPQLRFRVGQVVAVMSAHVLPEPLDVFLGDVHTSIMTA